MADPLPYAARSRRPRPALMAGIVVLHAIGIYLLARAFAPDATASVERAVLSTFTVTVDTKPPPPPPPDPSPEPDPGAAGDAGRKAVAKEVAAPQPKIVVKPRPPAPKASATGTDTTSGARETGTGTGAGGAGSGTGSGAGGSGQGGGAVASPPVLVSGSINNARDYPIPPGGREARIGTQVIVKITVGTDGRASNCTVFRPSPDAEADRITCRLVVERLRFRPAIDTAGRPVDAPFYWRQKWF